MAIDSTAQAGATVQISISNLREARKLVQAQKDSINTYKDSLRTYKFEIATLQNQLSVKKDSINDLLQKHSNDASAIRNLISEKDSLKNICDSGVIGIIKDPCGMGSIIAILLAICYIITKKGILLSRNGTTVSIGADVPKQSDKQE